MKLSQVVEAKHTSMTADSLAVHLIQVVEDAFADVEADQFSTAEDYYDALMTKVLKDVEKALPDVHKDYFARALWSTYHDLDESEFYDVESFVDALFNDLVKDIRWYAKRIEL